jgi:hypothetical protein
VPSRRRGFVDSRGSTRQQEYLSGPEVLAAVRITGYFVGAGRIHFEFMDWIKLWITGFLDLVHHHIFYVKEHNISEGRSVSVPR